MGMFSFGSKKENLNSNTVEVKETEVEQSIEEKKKEYESLKKEWTPKQNAAFEFLLKKWSEDTIYNYPVNSVYKKVIEIAKNPETFAIGLKYDEKTNTFSNQIYNRN